MVPGLDAAVVRLRDSSAYFSLPFNSTIFTVMGKSDLNSVAVGLSYSVAVNVLSPILSLIVLPVDGILWFSPGETFLLHDAQLISEIARKESRKKGLITPVLKRLLIMAKCDLYPNVT